MKTSLLSLRHSFIVAAVLSVVSIVSASDNEALHWNRIATATTGRVHPLNPFDESRILAVVHLAMHDAANSVAPRFATYAPAPAEKLGGSADASVASAAYTALRELMPEHTAGLETEFETRTHLVADAAERDRGIAAGRRAANQILALRKNDGAANAVSWPAGKLPGQYRPTPPDLTPAVFSHWGSVRPFALSSSKQFRPIAPPSIGSAQAIADIEEVRTVGGATSARRTFEQSEIACYWYEASTQGWNRIAREVGTTRGLDLWENARLLALVNVAMADGYVGVMEAKYHYNYWRPATAIRERGESGWLSFLPTPPVPDYPSGHTVLGAAAATAMARCLGTDYVSFTMTSGQPYPNISRRFWSLSQAAQENGASRVFAGIHFTTAVQAGYRQGMEIGGWAAGTILRPLGEKPVFTLVAQP
ncbi:MAG TPA: vanadium-dependent haloperoxidase [Opitutaceae bacterium]|nr:vanadium-dependent haloperoxidase [Opitutaceae bacterium]